ncbi:MAG: hypothetical protein U9N04_02595 [Patescibacteria group bacterium]|nr:hypothetical protein [Patescibacteria group bacterium]
MEKKKENFTDAIICILVMFLIIWVLTVLDKKVDKSGPTPYRPIEDEGHLRWADG